MNHASPFTDPLAVEIWDARFRCRENGKLRDLTIEATWHRVAASVAAVETRNTTLWTQRFADAFALWQLLPGEGILQTMGAPAASGSNVQPTAVLNAAAFVRTPFTAHARFDTDRFTAVAELAVRLLDNVLVQEQPADSVALAPLRIGLIGYADALYLLGLRYDSDTARALALSMAKAMTEGCLSAATGLAADRGAAHMGSESVAWRGRKRGLHGDLLDDVHRWGVRHPDLTAIDSRLSLALLANNVADALDPLAGPDHAYPVETPTGMRIIRSSGAAIAQAHRRKVSAAVMPIDTIATVPVEAQLQLRATLQPWIDAPIEYPIAVAGQLQAASCEHIVLQAQALGLPPISWRHLNANNLHANLATEH